MVIRLSGVLLLLVLGISSAWGQEAVDLAFILNANPIQSSPQRETIRLNLKETSELKLFSTSLIRLYQKLISTQDRPVCNFTPSCSRFGMGAIQKYGFLRGLLLAADRLLRDHGMISAAHYPIDERTGHYFDPVENYSNKALSR